VTNVAARLAALGAGDSVFIGAETARRLSGWLTLEDLGERELRNVEEPVRVFRLAAPGRCHSFFELDRAGARGLSSGAAGPQPTAPRRSPSQDTEGAPLPSAAPAGVAMPAAVAVTRPEPRAETT
jgi:hypothetical protein